MITILSGFAISSMILAIKMNSKNFLFLAMFCIFAVNITWLNSFNWLTMLELIMLIFTFIALVVAAYNKNRLLIKNKIV